MAGDPHFVGTHITNKNIAAAHDLAHIGKDTGRLHGAAVVCRHRLMLRHHRLAEDQCKLRLTGAVGTAKDLIQALRDVAHHFHGGLIPLVDVGGGAVDVDDGHILPCAPLGR